MVFVFVDYWDVDVVVVVVGIFFCVCFVCVDGG